MAHFYGEIQGYRGAATRMGSKDGGFAGHIRGWSVGCRVQCFHDEKTDTDIVQVYRTSGSNGGRSDVLIATLYENDEAAFQHEANANFGIVLHPPEKVEKVKQET